MLIKTATDLRFACAPEFALGFAAAMAKTILGSTFALLPTLQCLACFTKIYNIAHCKAKPLTNTRETRKPPDEEDMSAKITTIRWRGFCLGRFASSLMSQKRIQ